MILFPSLLLTQKDMQDDTYKKNYDIQVYNVAQRYWLTVFLILKCKALKTYRQSLEDFVLLNSLSSKFQEIRVMATGHTTRKTLCYPRNTSILLRWVSVLRVWLLTNGSTFQCPSECSAAFVCINDIPSAIVDIFAGCHRIKVNARMLNSSDVQNKPIENKA